MRPDRPLDPLPSWDAQGRRSAIRPFCLLCRRHHVAPQLPDRGLARADALRARLRTGGACPMAPDRRRVRGTAGEHPAARARTLAAEVRDRPRHRVRYRRRAAEPAGDRDTGYRDPDHTRRRRPGAHHGAARGCGLSDHGWICARWQSRAHQYPRQALSPSSDALTGLPPACARWRSGGAHHQRHRPAAGGCGHGAAAAAG